MVPGLYIGGMVSAENPSLLKSLGVTHILICAVQLNPRFPKMFRYYKADLQDTVEEDLLPCLSGCTKFIHGVMEERQPAAAGPTWGRRGGMGAPGLVRPVRLGRRG